MIASILFLLPWQELDRPYLAQSSRDLLPVRDSGLWEVPPCLPQLPCCSVLPPVHHFAGPPLVNGRGENVMNAWVVAPGRLLE